MRERPEVNTFPSFAINLSRWNEHVDYFTWKALFRAIRASRATKSCSTSMLKNWERSSSTAGKKKEERRKNRIDSREAIGLNIMYTCVPRNEIWFRVYRYRSFGIDISNGSFFISTRFTSKDLSITRSVENFDSRNAWTVKTKD